MEWKNELPASEGIYLFATKRSIRCVTVYRGNWQKAQNPLWYYAGRKLVANMRGQWLGPIQTPSWNEKRKAKC